MKDEIQSNTRTNVTKTNTNANTSTSSMCHTRTAPNSISHSNLNSPSKKLNFSDDNDNGNGNDHENENEVDPTKQMMNSPQPPRVLVSAQERKRLILLRRAAANASNGTSNGTSNSGTNKNIRNSRKRRRSCNSNSFSNSVSYNNVNADTNSSTFPTSHSQLYSNLNVQTNSQTQTNMNANTATSTHTNDHNNESNNNTHSPPPSNYSYSNSQSRQSLFADIRPKRNLHLQVQQKQQHRQQYKQHKQHKQHKQQNSSLFGEIMKRTQWEQKQNSTTLGTGTGNGIETTTNRENNDDDDDDDNDDENMMESKLKSKALPEQVLISMSVPLSKVNEEEDHEQGHENNCNDNSDNNNDNIMKNGTSIHTSKQTDTNMNINTNASLPIPLPKPIRSLKRGKNKKKKKNIFKQQKIATLLSSSSSTLPKTLASITQSASASVSALPKISTSQNIHESPSGTSTKKRNRQNIYGEATSTSKTITDIITNNNDRFTDPPLFSTHNTRHNNSDNNNNNNEDGLERSQQNDKDDNDYDNDSNDIIKIPYNSEIPTTPKKTMSLASPTSTSKIFNKRENSPDSPGGFSLQRLLDGCMDPELAYNSNAYHNINDNVNINANANNATSGVEDEGSRDSINSTGSANGSDEWHEGNVCLPKFVCVAATNNYDECNISQLSRGELDIVDWSLKKTLKFECHPGGCIPGHSFSPSISPSSHQTQDINVTKKSFSHICDQSRVERLAMKLLTDHQKVSNVVPKSSSNRKEEEVLSQWQAGLMYWQHPSIYPLPSSIMRNEMGTSKKEVRRSSSSSSRGVGTSVAVSSSRSNLFADSNSRNSNKRRNDNNNYGNRSRGREQSMMSRLGSLGLGGLGKNSSVDNNTTKSVSSLLHKREFEWQQCFRSLFHTWMSQINQLNEDISNDSMSGDNPTDASSRIYFYSIAPGSTILFKALLTKKRNENPSTSKDEDQIEPTIIISSSTFEMRSILRSMGICLRFFGKHNVKMNGNIDNIDEDFIDEWFKEKTINEGGGINESLRRELEELRRATANGESVGAEVSFLHLQKKANNNANKKKPSDFPPLLVTGKDDCMVFFEYYLNTCGGKANKMPWRGQGNNVRSTSNGDANIVEDVTLLLSRSLGPTRYMTLKELSVVRNRQAPEQNNDESITAPVEETQNHSLVDVKGIILPCAVRDLLCASVCHLSLDKKNIQSSSHNLQRENEVDERDRQRSEMVMDTKNSSTNHDEINDESSNTLGSHYLVMHLHAHEGEKRYNDVLPLNLDSSKKIVGSGTSELFNNGSGLHDEIDTHKHNKKSNTHAQQDCNIGEALDMVVWDISRPFSIAYKSDPVTDTGTFKRSEK